jgi:hypothetical protein
MGNSRRNTGFCTASPDRLEGLLNIFDFKDTERSKFRGFKKDLSPSNILYCSSIIILE